ncbi:hypothetical protein CC80DRAFT_420921, partial [Byssothecium circinans]
GLSMDKAVITVSKEQDHCPSLMYVALLRVKTVNSLMFKDVFSYQRLKQKRSKVLEMREWDIRRRARHHVIVQQTIF